METVIILPNLRFGLLILSAHQIYTRDRHTSGHSGPADTLPIRVGLGTKILTNVNSLTKAAPRSVSCGVGTGDHHHSRRTTSGVRAGKIPPGGSISCSIQFQQTQQNVVKKVSRNQCKPISSSRGAGAVGTAPRGSCDGMVATGRTARQPAQSCPLPQQSYEGYVGKVKGDLA